MKYCYHFLKPQDAYTKTKSHCSSTCTHERKNMNLKKQATVATVLTMICCSSFCRYGKNNWWNKTRTSYESEKKSREAWIEKNSGTLSEETKKHINRKIKLILEDPLTQSEKTIHSRYFDSGICAWFSQATPLSWLYQDPNEAYKKILKVLEEEDKKRGGNNPNAVRLATLITLQKKIEEKQGKTFVWDDPVEWRGPENIIWQDIADAKTKLSFPTYSVSLEPNENLLEEVKDKIENATDKFLKNNKKKLRLSLQSQMLYEEEEEDPVKLREELEKLQKEALNDICEKYFDGEKLQFTADGEILHDPNDSYDIGQKYCPEWVKKKFDKHIENLKIELENS